MRHRNSIRYQPSCPLWYSFRRSPGNHCSAYSSTLGGLSRDCSLHSDYSLASCDHFDCVLRSRHDLVHYESRDRKSTPYQLWFCLSSWASMLHSPGYCDGVWAYLLLELLC
uniref:Uncharacterized protein n=1 Tax=Cacopsylla melanoneura TaxID=428564 RepID=A0A8D9B193_9HEMI